MARRRRNGSNREVGIPLEQIKYDPIRIKEQLTMIKRKRAIVNNSLIAVSFMLVIAAIVLLILFFVSGNKMDINEERILNNLRTLYFRNSEIIAVHSKINIISLEEVFTTTIFLHMAPNFCYWESGIKELIDKISSNIYPEQRIKYLCNYIVANSEVIGCGVQQLVSTIKKNFSSVSHGFQEILAAIDEKIQQIRK